MPRRWLALSLVRVGVSQNYVGLERPFREGDGDRGFPAGDRRLGTMIRVQREDFDVGAELERLAAGNPWALGSPASSDWSVTWAAMTVSRS